MSSHFLKFRRTLMTDLNVAQGDYQEWWDTTLGSSETSYVDPAIVINQLKVDTQTSNSITTSRDGSQSGQTNSVTYRYGTERDQLGDRPTTAGRGHSSFKVMASQG